MRSPVLKPKAAPAQDGSRPAERASAEGLADGGKNGTDFSVHAGAERLSDFAGIVGAWDREVCPRFFAHFLMGVARRAQRMQFFAHFLRLEDEAY